MESAKGFKKFFNEKMVTLLVLLVIVVAAFTVLSKNGSYLHPANIRNIFSLMVVTSLLTLAVGCLMISGNIDLSTGANGTLCGILFALLLQGGVAWPVALIATLLIGMAIGAFNATLVNIVGFQPFIATMAVASVAKGLTYVANNAVAVPVKDPVITWIGTERFFNNLLPVTLIIAIVAFVFYTVLMGATEFGRSVYLIGGNREAARLSGIHPVKISYILFINSGMLSALAGILLAARLKSGTVTGVVNMQFSGMTAAMLGGVSFGGGSGGFGGVFIGMLIINGFNNGLTVLGVSSYWQTVASGVLLLFALTVDYLNMKRRGKRVSKRG
ncbi:MAG: ABC transporter permease [Oscillospiraceae bacterium]|jgi:ribose/xylose/arabinose/galactoside ABC-type transport system permease subunit|nr:ABC transporter permease [Oscillospiraceae bacterium]